MIGKIDPMQTRLTALLGEEDVSAPAAPSKIAQSALYPGNAFEDMLSNAVSALEGVSKTEALSNQMINGFLAGKVDLQDVMVQSSKMNVMVQMASTTINLAVSTFKELTQMQV